MNGTELCEQDCGTFVLPAPRNRLSTATDQCLQAPPARYESCPEPTSRQRSFAPPERLSLPETAIPGSKFPACCFDALPALFQTSRPFAPPPIAVSTPQPTVSSLGPLAWRLHRYSRFLLGPPLPLGAFLPLRIKVFSPIRFRASSPSKIARSPFAPRSQFDLSFGYGSTFQVRYDFVSLLFLKPLGTSFIMLPSHRIVKQNVRSICAFPQVVYGLISSTYGPGPVHNL